MSEQDKKLKGITAQVASPSDVEPKKLQPGGAIYHGIALAQEDAQEGEEAQEGVGDNIPDTENGTPQDGEGFAGTVQAIKDAQEAEAEEQDAPTVEQVCAYMSRHPQERYGEIMEQITAMINLKGPGNAPSMAEILAQREAEEIGPVFHGFVSMVERVEQIRQAVALQGEALGAILEELARTAPGIPTDGEIQASRRVNQARDLLAKAEPSALHEADGLEDPEEGVEA